MRRALACLLTTTVVLLAPGAAHAGSSARNDPDDTQGRLDIKRVALKTVGKKIVGTLRTHDAFSNRDLQVPNTIGVDFKVGKEKIRGLGVRSKNGRLRANICTYTPNGPVSGRACSKVRVKRINSTTVRFTVPRAKVAKGAKVYRWRGSSLAFGLSAGCSISPFCLDTMGRNPDQWFRLKG